MAAPTGVPSAHSRFEVLDGMRGIAAIMVMIFHFSSYRTHELLSNATLAVDVFFVLSGFVIAHSYGERLRQGMKPVDYVIKRLIRLYPMFLFGILFGAPVLLMLQATGAASGSAGSVAGSLLVNLFYLPSFVAINVHNMGNLRVTVGEVFPTNPPAWSLFFEIVASVFFLFIYRLGIRSLFVWTMSFFVAFFACGMAHYLVDRDLYFYSSPGWGKDNLYGGLPRALFGFTMGVLLYRLSALPLLNTVRAWVVARSKCHALIYLALALILLYPHQHRGAYQIMVLLVAGPVLVLVASFAHCTGSLNLKVTHFLGWISYPLYCVHFTVGRAVYLFSQHVRLSHTATICISIVLSIAIAALACRLYEEPFRRYLSKRAAQFSGASVRPEPVLAPAKEFPPAN